LAGLQLVVLVASAAAEEEVVVAAVAEVVPPVWALAPAPVSALERPPASVQLELAEVLGLLLAVVPVLAVLGPGLAVRKRLPEVRNLRV